MSTQRWVIVSLFMLFAAILLAAVMTPSLRLGIQNYFARSGREVLATAEGDLLGDQSVVKVVKYRNEEGIFVEVLKVDAAGATSLVDHIQLPDKHDGLFNYQGHVTRLAIADVDGDGTMELLAPSFDNQLVPHLNVFRYNPGNQKFEAYQPPPAN